MSTLTHMPESLDIMDNFCIHIVARSRSTLVKTLDLILSSRNYQVRAFSIDDKKGLVLYAVVMENTMPLPYAMDTSTLVDFIHGWMASVKASGQGAWEAYAGENNHSDGVWYAHGWELTATHQSCEVCAIKPAWALVGK